MSIDFTKPVQTKSGFPVRILCTDAKRLYSVVGLFVVFLCSCTKLDQGKCLATHQEEQWYQPPALMIPRSDGNVDMIPQFGYYRTVDVCDKWEFPNGRKRK